MAAVSTYVRSELQAHRYATYRALAVSPAQCVTIVCLLPLTHTKE